MKTTKKTWVLIGGLVSFIAASIGCVGSIVALGLGLGGFAATPWMAEGRPYFLATAIGLLALAWYLTYRRPCATCGSGGASEARSSGRASKVSLWIVTALALPLGASSWLHSTGATSCSAPGCAIGKSGGACATPSTQCGHGNAGASSDLATTLAPWEPMGAMFAGRAKSCGVRASGRANGVVAQPAATLGQRTYCPVSGVVFQISEASPHREVGETRLYFCCEACAVYFPQNRDRVLAARIDLARTPKAPGNQSFSSSGIRSLDVKRYLRMPRGFQ